MRVLNVNPFLDPKTGGGTAERTFQMSLHLANSGLECTVLTIDTGLDALRISALKPARVVALPLLLRRFYVPVIRWRVIRDLVDAADIVHLMGHWTLLNALVYIAVRRAKKPYVVCPAGALLIYGRSKLLKAIYNLVVGRRMIRNASAWIAVTTAEFSHFKAYGIASAKINVIPNGVSGEDFIPQITEQEFRRRYHLSDAPIILFMGRLNPIKGPDLLLQAFCDVKQALLGYQLVFAGPDEGMQAMLMVSAEQNGISDKIHFLGYLGSLDKVSAYYSARLLVVPSRQEAMSIVALEAGICGTPVMVTDQCGFGEIKSIDEGLEVLADAEGIATGLKNLLTQPEKLDRIAVSFRQFVMQKYSWDSVVLKYVELYLNLLVCQTKK